MYKKTLDMTRFQSNVTWLAFPSFSPFKIFYDDFCMFYVAKQSHEYGNYFEILYTEEIASLTS